jgi:hypothetical protein
MFARARVVCVVTALAVVSCAPCVEVQGKSYACTCNRVCRGGSSSSSYAACGVTAAEAADNARASCSTSCDPAAECSACVCNPTNTSCTLTRGC